MANVDYNTKLKSFPFGEYLTTGDLRGSLASSPPMTSVPTANSQVPPGVSPDLAFALQYGKPTPEELDAQSEREFTRTRRLLTEQDLLARSQADYRQKLGKESTAEAFKYKMIQQGLDKITNAFNPYGSKEGALAYAAHLNNLPNVVNDTMRSIPMMKVQGVAYNAPQRQYFA